MKCNSQIVSGQFWDDFVTADFVTMYLWAYNVARVIHFYPVLISWEDR